MTANYPTNRLLAALHGSEAAGMEPHLERVDLAHGKVLYENGSTIQHVYFPENCVISVVAVLEDGTSPEMITIGREGMAGLLALLGTREAFGRYNVQVPGKARRVSLDRLQGAFNQQPELRKLLLTYLHAALAQTLQTVACNAVHPVEARCCRWILMTHDRVGLNELPLTHEFLAAMLGVHRPTVSIVTRTLQTARLITQRRKAITVVDRAGLEEATCECYSRIRHTFERLLPQTYSNE